MREIPPQPIDWPLFLAQTSHLSTLERAALLFLRGAAWARRGRLPDDDEQLARMAGFPERQWTTFRPVLERFFTVEDGCWLSRDLEKEADRAERTAATNRERARTAALARHHGKGRPHARSMLEGCSEQEGSMLGASLEHASSMLGAASVEVVGSSGSSFRSSHPTSHPQTDAGSAQRTPQQERIGEVEAWFLRHGIAAPKPSVLGKWLRSLGWAVPELLALLDGLAAAGVDLVAEPARAWGAVQAAAKRRDRRSPPPKRSGVKSGLGLDESRLAAARALEGGG
ncbi:MAG TPA: DUF1376 domain-containing protein [Thermoanaerobaculia bacterium]|nr:DUF1376 domain-containing protein [Thermoanaerobaculia bacterium]